MKHSAPFSKGSGRLGRRKGRDDCGPYGPPRRSVIKRSRQHGLSHFLAPSTSNGASAAGQTAAALVRMWATAQGNSPSGGCRQSPGCHTAAKSRPNVEHHPQSEESQRADLRTSMLRSSTHHPVFSSALRQHAPAPQKAKPMVPNPIAARSQDAKLARARLHREVPTPYIESRVAAIWSTIRPRKSDVGH
jgi:hypothetical protein